MRRFKVSRPTVRQALDVLVQEGRLYRHAGRGTFSTATSGGDPRLRVIGSVGDMIALGDETWFKLVSREAVPIAPNIAQALRLPPGSHAPIASIGVRHGDHGPVPARDRVRARPRSASAIAEEDCRRRRSSRVIERQMGVAIKLMEQVTDAALAPRQVAELLQVRPRTPLLLFERTYFSANGEPVEHAISYQTGRRYPYRVVLSRSRTAGPERDAVPRRVRRRRHVHRLRAPGRRRPPPHRQAAHDASPTRPGRAWRGSRAGRARRRSAGRDLAQAVHGTTLGSNVVIERKGGRVALLTTRGFRDVLIIGREKRYQLYDLQIEKPAPLVPRSLHPARSTERVLVDGEVLTPLDEADCAARRPRAAPARGRRRSPSASSTPTSNPAHERRAAEIVREEAPDVAVSLSSRGLADVPRVRAHVDDRRQRLRDDRGARLPRAARGGAGRALGYRGRLFVMQSVGRHRHRRGDGALSPCA